MAIERFTDEYKFLSNMYLVRARIITPDDIAVKTVEHAYQASKFNELDLRQKVYEAETGIESKEIANELEEAGALKRADWEEKKVEIMRGFVRQKFNRDQDLQEQLLATGNKEIIEGNTWGDTFWGVSPPRTGEGLNWLGRILMDTRQEIRTKREDS